MNPEADIFTMGKDALAAARLAGGGQAFFVAARRLQADGSWSGPSGAPLALVEDTVLANVGGLAGARAAGANAALCELGGGSLHDALACGLRTLLRVPYAADEPDQARRQRVHTLAALVQRESRVDGIVPTPTGEAQGLDTLQFFAACRMACPSTHLVVDLELLGQSGHLRPGVAVPDKAQRPASQRQIITADAKRASGLR